MSTQATDLTMPISFSQRRQKGSITELGAVLVIVLPLLILLFFVAFEYAWGYLIKSNIDSAAKNASRAMAIAYGLNAKIADDVKLQQNVYSGIRIANFVNDNAQFSPPLFTPVKDPTQVTVTVNYLSGQFKLPPYPYPDPLNMGNTLKIFGTYTYKLESQ